MAALALVATVLLSGGVAAQDASQALSELAREEARETQLRSALLAGEDESALTDGGGPYRIAMGVYGAYNPSIRPRETWIDIACFGEPGRSRGGFSLLKVDIRLYRRGRLVLDTSRNGIRLGDTNGSTVCNIGRGVDTSFFDVDRSLQFDRWQLFVTRAERRVENVRTGGVIRPVTEPGKCPKARRCRQSMVIYEGPVHLYR